MLYADKQLTYRLRKDLIMYKSKEHILFNNSNLNAAVDFIYKHCKVPVTEFTEDYLIPVFKKLAKENKETMIMGNFNINILNCDSDRDISSFIDTISSNFFCPTINIATQIICTSKILIDLA